MAGSGDLALERCIVADNIATGGFFGGAWAWCNPGSLTISDSTFSGNTADGGGGAILAESLAVTVSRTVIAGNTAPVSPDCRETFVSEGFNLVGDDSVCSGFSATGDQVGTSGSPIDPLLAPLENNSGPTDTHLPRTGSAAPLPGRLRDRGYLAMERVGRGVGERRIGAGIPSLVRWRAMRLIASSIWCPRGSSEVLTTPSDKGSPNVQAKRRRQPAASAQGSAPLWRLYNLVYNSPMEDQPISWLGTSLADVRAFPAEARRAAGYQLRRVQQGLMPTDWKSMATVGTGVAEIRLRGQFEHRLIYIAKFAEAIYILHAFEKKTQRTRKRDLDLARRRLRDLEILRRTQKEP